MTPPRLDTLRPWSPQRVIPHVCVGVRLLVLPRRLCGPLRGIATGRRPLPLARSRTTTAAGPKKVVRLRSGHPYNPHS